MTLDNLLGHTFFYENLCLHKVDTLNFFFFFQRLGVKQNVYCRKKYFDILRGTFVTLMTPEVILD